MQISKKTEKILEALKTWAKEHSQPPTLRELAKEAGLKSTWTVRYHLAKLARAGVVKLKNSISRGIELSIKPRGIPLLGKVSAGRPIEAIENVDEYIYDLPELFGVKEMFALRVKGDSMEGEGILDNDILFVKKQETAYEGDIVAALLGTETVVKKFYKDKNGVRLVSANPKYEDIISRDARIIGKIVGVVRRY
jgi:repressor LexA